MVVHDTDRMQTFVRFTSQRFSFANHTERSSIGLTEEAVSQTRDNDSAQTPSAS